MVKYLLVLLKDIIPPGIHTAGNTFRMLVVLKMVIWESSLWLRKNIVKTLYHTILNFNHPEEVGF